MHPITQELVKSWLPVRRAEAHKGCFGRVLVVAGSRRMCGAGLLCAKSVLAAGAGLVYWALPASMQSSFAAALPEAITLPLPENEQGEIAASAWEIFPEICARYNPSLIVVVPGWGKARYCRYYFPIVRCRLLWMRMRLMYFHAKQVGIRLGQRNALLFLPHTLWKWPAF